ncbi:MAG: hypothetical protein HC848_03415 [Limnobacter sp.]|nr:hypothetical protein [Limnobacter sp.]
MSHALKCIVLSLLALGGTTDARVVPDRFPGGGNASDGGGAQGRIARQLQASGAASASAAIAASNKKEVAPRCPEGQVYQKTENHERIATSYKVTGGLRLVDSH